MGKNKYNFPDKEKPTRRAHSFEKEPALEATRSGQNYSFSNQDFSYEQSDLFDRSRAPYLHQQLVGYLKQNMVGQDRAIDFMATTLVAQAQAAARETETGSKRLLLIGPSGSGKTTIARLSSEFFGLPYADKSLPGMTAEGFQGGSLYDCLEDLTKQAQQNLPASALTADPNLDLKLASYGIVLLDELDKIAKKKNQPGTGVGDKDVQNQMLHFFEEGRVQLKDGRYLSTNNIFFILTGAFAEIEVDKYSQDSLDDWLDDRQSSGKISTDALIEYGIDGQLIGRLPTIVQLSAVPKEQYRAILTKKPDPKTKQIPLDSLLESLHYYFPNLQLERSAINFLVEHAYAMNIGARGIKRACEEAQNSLGFLLRQKKIDHNSKIKVDEELIKEALALE